MACPCSLSRTLNAIDPRALDGYTPEQIQAIDRASPGDSWFEVHALLEEHYIAPLMGPREQRRFFGDHTWIRMGKADAAFIRRHGAFEEVEFAKIRQRLGVV